MFAPEAKQRETIMGAWRGDGYLHNPTKGNPSLYWEYVTISRTLACQLQQALFLAGIVGQISSTQHQNRQLAYVLSMRGTFVRNMAELIRVGLQGRREKPFSRLESGDGYVYARI